jgi:hypothetical protein
VHTKAPYKPTKKELANAVKQPRRYNHVWWLYCKPLYLKSQAASQVWCWVAPGSSYILLAGNLRKHPLHSKQNSQRQTKGWL